MSLGKYQLFLESCSRKAIRAFKKICGNLRYLREKKIYSKKSAPQISLTHADKIVMKSKYRWEIFFK